jgi:hypothetical protein
VTRRGRRRSEEPCLGHHLDDLGAVEVGDRHGGRVERRERLDGRAQGHGRVERVLQCVAVGQRLLALFAGEVLDELLRLVRVVAGGEDARARDGQEGARVLVAEEVELGVVAVVTGLGLVAVPVVVVDDPDRRLPRVDRLEDNVIAVVRDAVGLDTVEPLLGSFLALDVEHGRDDRLEVRAGG